MTPVSVSQGTSPIILAMPHGGTFVPSEIAARLNKNGLMLADTDWHIDQLYEGLLPNATTVRANFHRYVIDANRAASDESLYPGQNTTGLVPLTDFDGLPIWHEGGEPNAEDISGRLIDWHAPYHDALQSEIERIKALHGVALVYDCHSIRSRIPYLFEGKLPDFNIGTFNGQSCTSQIEALTATICADAKGFTSVLNGRFKGGWTTRHYGQPDTHIHAIQMEIAQAAYLQTETAPFDFDRATAAKIRVCLSAILNQLETLILHPNFVRSKP